MDIGNLGLFKKSDGKTNANNERKVDNSDHHKSIISDILSQVGDYDNPNAPQNTNPAHDNDSDDDMPPKSEASPTTTPTNDAANTKTSQPTNTTKITTTTTSK
ncbi:unnamed protein product [Cunninghamella echinulata]